MLRLFHVFFLTLGQLRIKVNIWATMHLPLHKLSGDSHAGIDHQALSIRWNLATVLVADEL